MTQYAFADPDESASAQLHLLVIGTAFPLAALRQRFTVATEFPPESGAPYSAILIEGAAITPEIAARLRGRHGADTSVIVSTTDADADRVGLLLETDLHIVDDPADEDALLALLAGLRRPGQVADAGGFAHADRILELQRDAQRIAQAISELAEARPAETARPVTAPRIRAHIRARRLRDRFFSGDLFADPAWDMLLDLAAARLEGRRVSVSSLCIAAAVPTTTALRWVKTLVDRGLFLRASDPEDARRAFIHLSAEAGTAMDACLDAVLNQPGQ